MYCVSFIFRLACRCAKETSASGHSLFGLQYYGECWSDPDAAEKFGRYGKSEDCMGSGQKPCDDEDSSECVGGVNINYVYRIIQGEHHHHLLRLLSVKKGRQGIVLKRTCTVPPSEGSIRKTSPILLKSNQFNIIQGKRKSPLA